MWPLAAAFIDIALHRRGPQDLPASQFLVGLLLVVYFVVGFTALSIGASGDAGAMGFLVADAFVYYVGFVWLVLSIYKRQRRFAQTVSALLGADIFLNVLAIPLLIWNRALGTDEADLTLPTLLFIVLFFWSIDVAGYVLSRALERPYIAGVLIVILYVMTSMLVRESIAGP